MGHGCRVRFEGGGKLICKVGCIGGWVCVERGSEDVTFQIVNINGIVGAVLDGSSAARISVKWNVSAYSHQAVSH